MQLWLEYKCLLNHKYNIKPTLKTTTVIPITTKPSDGKEKSLGKQQWPGKEY
jgi:hypothetical protein